MKKHLNFIIILSFLVTASILSRNVRRPIDKSIPSITVQASNKSLEENWLYPPTDEATDKFTLKTVFLRLKPLKCGFDKSFFQSHFLPHNEFLTFRDKTDTVHSSILANLAEKLVIEIRTGLKNFSDFIVLKDKDFNYKSLSGLLILKYKKYPFVLKISIEHPQTIIQPFSKSFETTCIFMSGGNLRHLSNFTRITNLKHIKQILKDNPCCSLSAIDFPNKWYWQPQKSYDLCITWKCNDLTEEIILPSVYATLSDFVEIDLNYSQNELNKLAMKIAINTDFAIDPHAGNLVCEKNSHKFILLDTEDFTTMVGLSQGMKAKTYGTWYLELMTNWLKMYLFRTKEERIEQCCKI